MTNSFLGSMLVGGEGGGEGENRSEERTNGRYVLCLLLFNMIGGNFTQGSIYRRWDFRPHVKKAPVSIASQRSGVPNPINVFFPFVFYENIFAVWLFIHMHFLWGRIIKERGENKSTDLGAFWYLDE